MLGIAVVAMMGALAAPAPQDTGTVDTPVYENASYGVSVPRPFDDWVFEPGLGRRTTTVIFHPRASPLREQFWGALVLTTFPGQVPLGRIADQRVQAAWRPQLGSTFTLLTRDSLAVAGLPAIRVVMSGAINHVVVDAEEYVIARGGDLIVLQFRYPRGLPRDSVGAGYQRVLDGLRIRGVAAPSPPGPTLVFAESIAAPWVLPPSSWQVRSYDALVRYDTVQPRADFSVRVELVNDGPVPAKSVTVWLWPAFALDSVRTAVARLAPGTAGSVSRLLLPGEVAPQGSAAVTFFYHATADTARGRLPPSHLLLGPDGAYVATEWLPRVQPAVDSAGQTVRTIRPQFTVRLDVPDAWRAVAPGRLTSDVAALGRRRLTWTTAEMAVGIPAFALGPYHVSVRHAPGLAVTLWRLPSDTISGPAVDSLVSFVRTAWVFCSRAFGRLPVAEVSVVSTGLPAARGFAGLVLIGRNEDYAARAHMRGEIFREIARTWWGNSVVATGAGSGWIAEGFPAWTAIAAQGVLDGDTVRQRLVREAEAAWRSTVGAGGDRPLAAVGPHGARADLLRSKGVAALEAARRAAGEARFREAILTFALEHRGGWATLDDFLSSLGPDGGAVLRPFLF